MGSFDANPAVTCLLSLERSPSTDHDAAPSRLASASSVINRGSDHEADGEPRIRASLEAEFHAGLLGVSQPHARSPLGADQPVEPNSARLAALDEGDRNVDLIEGDLDGIAL